MKNTNSGLAKRERQIMDVLYRLKRATVAQVMAELPDERNYSTVRAQLRMLEAKGHVRHEEEGPRYVYVPSLAPEAARQSALRHLVETFFDGSAEKAAVALLGGKGARLSEEELNRLKEMLAKSRKERSSR
jgi:predicted transcriptional regulator